MISFNKMLRSVVASALLLTSFSVNKSSAYTGFDPSADFLDFDDIKQIFGKPNKEAIYIINDTECPVEILEAEIADRGTLNFKELREALSTFTAEVKNNSGKRILTYQLLWSEKHPFERYVNHQIRTNSVNVLAVNKKQKLKFIRDKYHRDDAFYEVRVSKVLFDDQTSWEAPEEELSKTASEEIEDEINSIKEKSIDEMSKEELLKHFGSKTSNGAELTSPTKSK